MKWIACSDRISWDELGLDVLEHRAWCRDPVLPEEDGWGLIGCAEDVDRHDIERRLRKAGFDPTAVPLIRLSKIDRTDHRRVKVLADTAAARVSRYRGTRQEHLKPVMPPVVSRRTFLTFSAPSYRTVPRPEATACGAADGCRACAEVCPHGALKWSKGAMEHDRLACQGCGRCVTACPAGAMINPAFTAEMIEVEIETLIRASDEAVGIMLHCARMEPPADQSGWFRVVVPCVAMIEPHWVIAPLLKGAAAVTVAPCGCGKESDAVDRVSSAVSGARSWLTAAGWSDTTKRIVDDPGTLPPVDVSTPGAGGSLLSPTGAATVAMALAPVVWMDERAPLGLISIDPDACTGCEMCATVCPSGALESPSDRDRLVIWFDGARCTACHQCVERCPESGAIALVRGVDSGRLGDERFELVSHDLVGCVRCGGTIATDAAIDRIAASLGDDESILKQITSLCLDCRGTSMVF